MEAPRRTYHIVLTLVFLGWISVPMIAGLFTGKGEENVSKSENRLLARKPVINLRNPAPYPATYEKYFNDHFFLRYELIHLNTLVVGYYIFSRSPVPAEVAFGQDGWLFTTGKEREIYDGRFTLPDDFIQSIADELHTRAEEYRRRGIAFYIAVAPMKCEVYPEFLPAYYTRSRQPTVTDRVMALLARDSLYCLIDLKASLLNAKTEGALYYKTDNHWNGLGAWEASSAILGCIGNDFPAVKPVKRNEFSFSRMHYSTGNLATLAGLQQYVGEMIFTAEMLRPRASEGAKFGYRPPPFFGYPSEYEVVRVVPDSKLPRIVVIRDSFFTPLIPLFSEKFRRTTCIFDAWKYGPNFDIIDNEKPDIVLLEVFEPNLPNVLSSLGR